MQTDRLFEIMYVLLEKKTVSAGELSSRLEVSAKTIYRDIDRLSAAGIPIYTSRGKGGGISILPDFVMDKAMLSEDEKQSILSAINAIEKISPAGHEALSSRVQAFLGGQAVDWLEVDFSSWSNAAQEKTLFQALKSAILSKRVVSFRYANSKGETSRRTVEPLKLGFKGQAWYLFAFCRERQDTRFFKLTRIKEPEVLPECFVRLAPEQVFPESTGFPDEFVTLRLRLSRGMAYRVYDEFTHIEPQSDGSFIVEISYPDGVWLWSYLASFGGDCEVLSPEHIRERYAAQLQKVLEKYL